MDNLKRKKPLIFAFIASLFSRHVAAKKNTRSIRKTKSRAQPCTGCRTDISDTENHSRDSKPFWQTLFPACFLVLYCSTALANNSYLSQKTVPPENEIPSKTEIITVPDLFHKFELPENWTVIDPGLKPTCINSDKAETWVIFRGGKVDVAITICAVSKNAEDAANALYANLKNLEKRYNLDADTKEPVKRNESWVVQSVMGATKDIWYLTGNGTHYSVISISGSRNTSLGSGKDFLKKLHPIDPTLFPRNYD